MECFSSRKEGEGDLKLRLLGAVVGEVMKRGEGGRERG